MMSLPAATSFYKTFLFSTKAMFLKWLMYIAVFTLTPDYVFSQTSGHKGSDDLIPCDKGWYNFRDKCYLGQGKKRSERCNWETAAKRCSDLGGSLVSIHSQEEQDFLVAFILLHLKHTLWIGLNDRVNESEYVWPDGSPMTYKNFRDREPDLKHAENEDCVEMVLLPEHHPIGSWNDLNCDGNLAYICEKKTYNRMKSLDPKYCDDGGIKFFSSCYHLVTEKKSWDDAEQHCIDKYDGHLVTIYDVPRAKFLDYILSDVKEELWIGIKIRNQHQQIWTSGWYVGYSGLSKDPYDFIEGICAIRTKQKVWKRVLCTKKYPFVCEKSTISPPVLKPPVEGSYCPQIPNVWSDLGGEYCYFVEPDDDKNWYEANFECMRKGGHLASLHSKEEVETLHSLILYTRITLFIGLFRSSIPDPKVKFRWADGSPVDYEKWNGGEPNSFEERCVEMFTFARTWNDLRCEDRRGYICSAKKIAPNSTKVVGDSNICPSIIPPKALIGIAVCIILVIILLAVVVYCFCRKDSDYRKTSNAVRSQPRPPVPHRPKYRTSELKVKEDDSYAVMR